MEELSKKPRALLVNPAVSDCTHITMPDVTTLSDVK